MQPITESTIRSSFINASRSEARKLTLPEGFPTLQWEHHDFLGWRDPKMPQRAYLVATGPDGTTRALLLRAPDTTPKVKRAIMCEICRDVNATNPVTMWNARRSGASGRNGNSLGTLICSDFQCPQNIRVLPPKNAINPDPAAVVAERIIEMGERLQALINRV